MFAFMYPTLSTDPHTTCIGKIRLGRKYRKDRSKKLFFKAVVLSGFSKLRICFKLGYTFGPVISKLFIALCKEKAKQNTC